MRRIELEKHKFDQKLKFGVFLALMCLAIFLDLQHSTLVGEVVGTLIGYTGGSVLTK
jgi:hypothetical protein